MWQPQDMPHSVVARRFSHNHHRQSYPVQPTATSVLDCRSPEGHQQHKTHKTQHFGVQYSAGPMPTVDSLTNMRI